MKISSIMERKVESIGADDSVHKACQMMEKLEIRHLPVLDKNKLIGIISERDTNLIRLAQAKLGSGKNTLEQFRVLQFMSPAPESLSPQDGIEKAMNLVIEKKYGALPVVEDGELVGIVTVIDLLKFGQKAMEAAGWL